MAQAALAGDFDTAAALQCQLQELNELMFCEINPVPVKAAMGYVGLDCGSCGAPSCRDLAEDVVCGFAKPESCVYLMKDYIDRLNKQLHDPNVKKEDILPPDLWRLEENQEV